MLSSQSLATELVNDGDTLQLGVGTVASAMGAFLGDKQDLGLHTEIITGGIADLVRNGVITGKHQIGTGTAALDPEFSSRPPTVGARRRSSPRCMKISSAPAVKTLSTYLRLTACAKRPKQPVHFQFSRLPKKRTCTSR